MKFFQKTFLFIFALLVLGGFGFGVNAATLYWVGNTDGANTNVAANWNTSAVACTASGNGTIPTNADTLIFTSSCVNSATFNASLTASTGGITVQSGYTGQIRGANGITYANPVTLQTNATIFVDTGNTFTLSGIIGDGGAAKGLSKTGAGQLNLSGANTFTGGLTIKAGTVLGQTSTSAFGGSGTGAITIGDTSGTADAKLTGNINGTFANPITVASGSSGNTLTLDMSGSVGGYTVFGGAITLSNNLTITSNGYLNNVSGGITGTGNVVLNNQHSSYGITISTTSVNMTGTITNSGSGGGSAIISAVIGTNVTGVIQNSTTSKLNLQGVNTFTGTGLTIKAGTVQGSVSTSAFGGSGTGAITIGDTSGTADATLQIITTSNTYNNPITVASGSSGTLSISGNIGSGGFSGAITLNNNLTVVNTNAMTLSGGITGTGNVITNNNSSNSLAFSTTSINNTGTITNSGSGPAATAISAVIGTAVTGVIQNSATSQLTLSGNNTFTSGLTIKAGTVQGQNNSSAFGSTSGGGTNGTITLGDTSGTADATLQPGSLLIANPTTVASGSSGVLSIKSAASVTLTFNGAITLNNNLTISNTTAGGTANFTGGITGTGNIIISNTTTGTITLSDGTKTINNIGTITNSGTGSGATTISAVIGTNVTGVVQNSATSELDLSGTNTFASGLTIKAGIVKGTLSTNAFGAISNIITIGDASGSANATLNCNIAGTISNPISVAAGSIGNALKIISSNTSTPCTIAGAITLNNNLELGETGTGTGQLVISSGITGTGNLTISNTSTGTTTLQTTSINPTGTITNSGSGSGATTISAVIGTNVTGVVQNSATSQLNLIGINTFTSGLTIKAGTVVGYANNAFGANTSVITIGDTSGSANAKLSGYNNSSHYFNPITVAAGSNGTLSVSDFGGSFFDLDGAITLNNNLTVISASKVALGGVTTSTGTGNIILTSSGTGYVNITGSINNTGTITNSGSGSGTNTISSVIGTNVTGIVQNSSTSKLLLSGNNSNTKDVTITSGTLELSGTTNLNVSGNWSNSGTFTKNTSTVTMTTGSHAISGTTTFNNFTINPANTVIFTSGTTQTFGGTLSCTGTAGNIINIRSTALSASTLSKASGTVSCDYVSIGYSTATGGATWNTGSHRTNNGNNSGWSFTPTTLPTSWQKKSALTIDKTKVPSTQTDFPVLLAYNAVGTEKNIPTEILDSASANKAKADGSDIRFSSDSAGATQLPFEIVKFTQSTVDANRKAEIWVKIPSLSSSTDTTIYIWYKNPNATALPAADTYGSQNVWTNGYVDVYHLKEASNPYSDSSSNANNSTGGTYPTQADAKIGKGQTFNGTTNYIDTTNNADNLANMTVSAWAKDTNSASTPTFQMIISKLSNYASGAGWSLFYFANAGGAPGAINYLLQQDGTHYIEGYGATNYADSAWHYITWVKTGNTFATNNIYVDGVLKTLTNLSSGTITTFTNSVNVRLGQDNNNEYYFKGSQDEIRISSAARSADWITAEYNNQSAPNTFWKASTISGWQKSSALTIDHTKVPSTQTDFPVLLGYNAVGTEKNIPAEILDSSGANKANADGSDIRFSSDANGLNQLPFEIVKFTQSATDSSRKAEIWVKIPSLSSSTDTTIYIWYKNPSATALPAADTYGSQNVWTNSYAGVWHLKETGTNPTVNDSTSNANNSTAQFWTPTTSGKTGGGASFNGSSQYISFADAKNDLSNFTISMWVKPNAAQTYYAALIAKGNTSLIKDANYDVMFNADSDTVINANIGNGTTYNGYTNLQRTLTSGDWNYVVFKVDGSYLDLANNNSYATHVVQNITPINNSSEMRLGGGASSDSQYLYSGIMDEVRISSTARSADWITAEYNNQNAPQTFWKTTGTPVPSGTTINTLAVKNQNTTASWLAGWTYRKKITVSNAKVGSDLLNFPLLVKLNADTLVGAKARSDGFDVRFTASDGTTVLSYERESFAVASSKATAVFWVKVPTITTASNTTVYIYYGNAAATTDWTTTAGADADATNCASPITPAQCTWKEGASQNFAGVYHLKEVSNATIYDSTSNAKNSSSNSGSQGTGKIGNDKVYSGTSGSDSMFDNTWDYPAFTAELWVYPNSPALYDRLLTTSSTPTNKFGIAWGDANDGGGANRSLVGFYSPSAEYKFRTPLVANIAWSHVVMTVSSNTIAMYINGSAVAAQSPVESGWSLVGGNFALASNSSGTLRNFKGSEDEFRISSTVRSADWVKFEYFNQASTNNQITLGVQEQTTSAIVKSKNQNTTASWLAGWTYRKKITVSNAKVSSDLSNFPLLVKLNADTLVGAKARSDGFDVRFTASDGSTVLSYERESFSVASSKATAVFWVKVPTITTASNTTVYIYYGNAAATTDWTTTAGADADATNCASPITPAQCTWKEGASQNFTGIWHSGDASTTTIADSTANAFTGTKASAGDPVEATGKIGKAQSYNGTTDYINTNKAVSNFISNSTGTISVWVKPTGTSPTITNSYKGQVIIGDELVPYNYIGITRGVLGGLDRIWIGNYATGQNDVGVPYTNDAWTNIVWQHSGGNLSAYKDGVFISSIASGATGSVADYLKFGGLGSNALRFPGLIDEIRASSTTRSADWVKFEYFNQASTNNQLTINAQEQSTSSTLKSTAR